VLVGIVALTMGGMAVACDDDEDNGNGGAPTTEPTAEETVPSGEEPTEAVPTEAEPTAAE